MHCIFIDIVKVLIEAGGDVNQATTEGTSPLHIASQGGYIDIVKVLLEAGSNVNHARTTDGASPLYIVSLYGNEATAKVLIKAGGNVNQAANDNSTALGVSCRLGKLEVVRLLLQQPNIDINKGLEGWSPLALVPVVKLKCPLTPIFIFQKGC